MSAFPIFCGWDRRQREAAEVFKRSVIDRATIPVEIEFASADLGTCRRRGVTTFTYARFMAPASCNFEGRALFADGCDQLCLGDVAELATLDMGGRAVMVVKHGWEDGPKYPRPRSWSSLMLLDCARFKCWTREAVEQAPDDQLMRFGAFPEEAIGELPGEWNALVSPGCEPPPAPRSPIGRL